MALDLPSYCRENFSCTIECFFRIAWQAHEKSSVPLKLTQWAKSPTKKNSLKECFFVNSTLKYSAILSKIHSYRLYLTIKKTNTSIMQFVVRWFFLRILQSIIRSVTTNTWNM